MMPSSPRTSLRTRFMVSPLPKVFSVTSKNEILLTIHINYCSCFYVHKIDYRVETASGVRCGILTLDGSRDVAHSVTRGYSCLASGTTKPGLTPASLRTC